MSTAELEIKNVGAIEYLSITPPKTGGVLVARGGNGVGKSTVIGCAKSLADGKTKMPKRDNAARGSIDGFGVLISISGRTVRNGEFEIENIEGTGYDADAIIDPQIDKPESADAERIKNILRLQGIKADKALFDECVGGEAAWAELISPDATKTDDIVLMAGRIKASLHKKAQIEEEAAENLEREAQVKREAAGEVNLELASRDEAELTNALTRTTHAHASLVEMRSHALSIERAADDAKLNLGRIEREYKGKSVVDAEAEVAANIEGVAAEEKEVAKIKEQLAQALANVAAARNRLDKAHIAADAARNHEKTCAAWRATIDREREQCPTDEQIAEADVAVTKAKSDLTQYTLARGAADKLEEAKAKKEQANRHAARGMDLRQRAKMVDQVLSLAVNCPAITIDDGRIYTKTDRGNELFSELSPGERGDIALFEIAVPALKARIKPGSYAMLPLSQEFWAALDDDRKQRLADGLKGTNIVAITAEATSGPLVIEEYSS